MQKNRLHYYLYLLSICCLIFCNSCKEEPIEPDNPIVPPIVDTTSVDTTSVFLGHFESQANITLNPSSRMPLAAQVEVITLNEVEIEVQVLGDEPYIYTIQDLATEHFIPVLGLYPNQLNEVLLIAKDSNNNIDTLTIEIQTEPLPSLFPQIDIVAKNESQMEPGWNLCDFSYAIDNELHTQPFMFDNNGDIRWYLIYYEEHRWTATIQRLLNGNWLRGDGWRLTEYDPLGFEINTWTVPAYFGQHHDVIEMPNGNFLIAGNPQGESTILDVVIEMDRENGSMVKSWSMTDYLDVDRTALLNDGTDWFHMNSVWYVAQDNSIIVSGRNQGICKIGYDDDELKWILAPHQAWGDSGIDGDGFDTNDYLLTAINDDNEPFENNVQKGLIINSDFEWVWGQHAAMVLPNGNVFVFDNGFNRNYQGSFYTYSRAVEYEINATNKTVKQKWQYGKNLAYLHSKIISDVDYLPQTGNILISPGYIFDDGHSARMTEIAYPFNYVVFDAKINFTDVNSTGSGWSQADLIYRSERLSLYPN